MNKTAKKTIAQKLFYVLKILISISLLTYLLLQIDWEKSFNTIRNANFIWLAVAILFSLLDMMLLTYKWNLLLKVRGMFVSFWRLFTINMIGGFWGLFLPSSLSTDVVRGYYLIKSSSDKAISITSIFVDRLFAMFALFAFVGTGLFFSGDILKDLHIGFYIIGFFVVSAIGVIVLNSNKFSRLMQNFDERFSNNNIVNKVIKLRSALIEYSKYPSTLLYSFVVSLVIQLGRVFWYISIAWAFGVEIPIVYYFIFCPLIIVILMIPVSIGGLGVREGAFVALFTLVGMKMDDAVIISFTSSLIANLFTISGGLFYLIYKSDHKIEDIKSAKIQINETEQT